MNPAIFIVEIKARCNDQEKIRTILKGLNADHKGKDHQIDHYFNVDEGRLKLRIGNIENTLIYYNRKEAKGLKESSVELVKLKKDQVDAMFKIQEATNGLKVTVDKSREIYFVGNVKFHIDQVKELGSFIEIEAINSGGEDKEKLESQCKYYCELFAIAQEDYVACSYSDLLLDR